jgi:hypothetical protein
MPRALQRIARSGDRHGRCSATHWVAGPRHCRPKARASVSSDVDRSRRALAGALFRSTPISLRGACGARALACSVRFLTILVVAASLSGCHGGHTPSQSAAPPQAPSRPCCSFIAASSNNAAPLRAAFRTGVPEQDHWAKLTDYPMPGGVPSVEDVDDVVLSGHEVHSVSVVAGPANLVDRIQGSDGAWSAIDLPNLFRGSSLRPSRVSTASVNGELNVCVTASGGQIMTVLRSNASPFDPEASKWQDLLDIESLGGGERGNFVDVGCAGVINPSTQQEELHICGVTDDGRLWHAIQVSRGGVSFSTFGDVEAQAGDQGDFVRVDCAANKSQLQLVGVTSSGRVFHTIRNPSGSWRPFEDVLSAAAPPPLSWLTKIKDVAIGYCNDFISADGPRDASELNVVVMDDSFHLWQTIRAANPISWSPTGGAPSFWRPHIDFDAEIGRSSGIALGGFSIGARPFFPYYTLFVDKLGQARGGIESSPGGIACGEITVEPTFAHGCQHTFFVGTKVTLMAKPTALRPAISKFTGWSGACSGTGSCVVTLDDDKTVTGTFNFQ